MAVIVCFSLLVAAGAWSAPAATAGSLKLPEVAGSMLLSASGTREVIVHLSRPVPVQRSSATWPIDARVAVSDAHNFFAVALVAVKRRDKPLGDHGNWSQRPSLAVVALPDGSGKRYFYYWNSLGVPATLPPGDYRLYVVAAGPERVVWHLPGGEGSTTLQVAGKASVHVAESVATSIPGTSHVVPMAAATGHFVTSPVAQIWQLTWLRGKALGNVTEADWCIFDGSDPVAVATAALPAAACDGLQASIGPVGVMGLPEPGEQQMFGGGVTPIDRPDKINTSFGPDVGAKVGVEVSGLVDRAVGFEMWLDVA